MKLAFLIFCQISFGQTIFNTKNYSKAFNVGFETSLISDQFTKSQYLANKFNFTYDWLPWMLKVEYSSNSFMQVKYENPIFSIPDSISQERLNGLSIKPNKYRLDIPIVFSSEFEHANYTFSMQNKVVVESIETNSVIGYKVVPLMDPLTYEESNKRQFSLLNNFLVTADYKQNQIGIGIKDVMFNLNSENFIYQYEAESYPFISYSYAHSLYFLFSSKEIGLTYDLHFSDQARLKASMDNFKNLISINFRFNYLIDDNYSFYVDFKKNLIKERNINIDLFGNILNEVDPRAHFQSSIIALGFNYSINDDKVIAVPIVESFSFFFNDIYTYNLEKNAANPFASITLNNMSESFIYCNLILESENGHIYFESEMIEQESGEKTSIPLYALIDKIPDSPESKLENFTISVNVDGHKKEIYRDKINIYGPSFWDKKFAGLNHFILQNDPYFNRKLKTEFLGQSGFKAIKSISKKIAEDLVYEKETRSENNAQMIKSPYMTYTSKIGSNEDLIVLFMYIFKALNIESIIFELDAQNNNADKMILLVNTGLNKNEINKDFNIDQGIIKKDKFNKNNIWIAMDLLKLKEGFDKVVESGAYYYNTSKND